MKWQLCVGMMLIMFSGCHSFQPPLRGSGYAQSEHRLLDSFDEIKLAGFGSVNVIAGQQQSVQVTTDDNLLDCIRTEVKDGQLRIETTRNIRPQTGLVVHVTVPEITAAGVSGSGDINLDGVSGQELELSISGQGDLKATGQVTDLKTKISGAGSADLQQLVADNAEIKISGAGDVDVFASQSLDVRVSGAGNVTCFGNPTQVSQRVSGAGSVNLR